MKRIGEKEWTDEVQGAWDKLKAVLKKAPVLSAPDYSLPFRVAYGDDHWKWHVSGGPVLGANETREFIIRSLGATRKGGGRNGNNTRVASTARCNQGELS